MAEEVGHLPGRERADGSIRLFDSVDQIGGEGVSEGMEPPLFQASRFQDAVVSLSKVYRPGITSVFIRDERGVLSEISLRSQIQDGVYCRLIEGHIPFAGGALQFTDFHLSAAGGFGAFPPENLFHAPLEVDDLVLQVDVAVQRAKGFPCAEAGVQHQRVGGRLLVNACSVAPDAERLGFKLYDFIWGGDRNSFEDWQILFALTGYEV